MKKGRICSGNVVKREPDDSRPWKKKKEKTLDLNLEKKKTKPKKPTSATGPPPRPEEAPRLKGARHSDGGHVHRRDAWDHGEFAIE